MCAPQELMREANVVLPQDLLTRDERRQLMVGGWVGGLGSGVCDSGGGSDWGCWVVRVVWVSCFGHMAGSHVLPATHVNQTNAVPVSAVRWRLPWCGAIQAA